MEVGKVAGHLTVRGLEGWAMTDAVWQVAVTAAAGQGAAAAAAPGEVATVVQPLVAAAGSAACWLAVLV